MYEILTPFSCTGTGNPLVISNHTSSTLANPGTQNQNPIWVKLAELGYNLYRFFFLPAQIARQKFGNSSDTLCFSGSTLTIYQINVDMRDESTDNYWELETQEGRRLDIDMIQ